jgi:branched-chain amino acid transport system ATP-binding protein
MKWLLPMSLLEVEGVNSYYGSSHVLFDVSLNVDDGETVVLLGRNGAGKTTTLKTIMGLLPPRSGTIRFAGDTIHGKNPEQIAGLGLQLVPEERNIFAGLTLEENLRLAALTAPNAWAPEMVYEIFPQLQERRLSRGRSLSGGEQQMLAIARALIRRPRLILLDEPFEGLAPKIVQDLIAVCRDLVYKNQTFVIVEQNVAAALTLATRCYVMNNGHVVFQGSPDDLKNSPDVVSRYLGV